LHELCGVFGSKGALQTRILTLGALIETAVYHLLLLRRVMRVMRVMRMLGDQTGR
jgi:hypothetical protein